MSASLISVCAVLRFPANSGVVVSVKKWSVAMMMRCVGISKYSLVRSLMQASTARLSCFASSCLQAARSAATMVELFFTISARNSFMVVIFCFLA